MDTMDKLENENEKAGMENGMSEEYLQTMDQVIKEKLIDAETPGFQAQFYANEAERIGAFVEDAMSEQDALDSAIDQQ